MDVFNGRPITKAKLPLTNSVSLMLSFINSNKEIGLILCYVMSCKHFLGVAEV